ncbi:phosphatase PAP2 family protein [Bradyrhizobium japonicum]|uniref:phosphatase PAP2 family protein n=1 Tax=Bradyrhizobium japonicum TaxID=375 RepID=UPI001269B83B|nr:phosphatase PAP2 family protein [Bradyrhizobium japonicum]
MLTAGIMLTRRELLRSAALAALNAGMLVAPPLVGGHYFVDVIAGVSVAALTIQLSKCLTAVVAASPLAVSTRSASAEPGRLVDPAFGRGV